MDYPVFLSLPCVVGGNGITDIVNQNLNESERGRLLKSAELLHQVQSNLIF